jgi:hypothetical protein
MSRNNNKIIVWCNGLGILGERFVKIKNQGRLNYLVGGMRE